MEEPVAVTKKVKKALQKNQNLSLYSFINSFGEGALGRL